MSRQCGRHGPLDLHAGGITIGMHDARMTVAAFARDGKSTICAAIETCAQVHEPLKRILQSVTREIHREKKRVIPPFVLHPAQQVLA